MKFTATVFIVLTSILSDRVAAICLGFDFAIGSLQVLGGGYSRWSVYDNNCTVVDGLTTNTNPCNQVIFGCSPPPPTFNHYQNSFDGLQYACSPDPNKSDECGEDPVPICCRKVGG